MKRREVVVIGGGVAGSAAAIRLAQNGQDVLLLEKEPAAHDKVCGEFIAADAQHYLRELGIDLAALDAERITGIRITRGQRTSSARLPFSALSLSRRVLDEALLVRAQDQGARVWRGAAVTALIKGPECWHIEVAGHGVIQAETIFLATGKHDLREWRRPRGTQNDFLGFKCHFLLTPTQRVALAEHVEMTLFNGGYAGLGLVESGKANLCLVVTRRHFAMYGKKWDGLLGAILKAAPLLAERLAGAEACWPRPYPSLEFLTALYIVFPPRPRLGCIGWGIKWRSFLPSPAMACPLRSIQLFWQPNAICVAATPTYTIARHVATFCPWSEVRLCYRRWLNFRGLNEGCYLHLKSDRS